VKVACIGAGPASLYSGILLKRQDPSHEVRIYERNELDDTFGFGVVFSDNTLDKLRIADEQSYQAITNAFAHWNDIDIHFRGQRITSRGHGFAGMARKTLLRILTERARELGVIVQHQKEITKLSEVRRGSASPPTAPPAAFVRSSARASSGDRLAPIACLARHHLPFKAFTFYFIQNQHGLWRVHALAAGNQSTRPSSWKVHRRTDIFPTIACRWSTRTSCRRWCTPRTSPSAGDRCVGDAIALTSELAARRCATS
jgi:anthraniloyl-CoA monooxygenase